MCQLLGIRKMRTAPYYPQSDSMVERFNRTFTNVQDCHKMSKLYLVHLRPLGLRRIFLVVLSIQVAVVPSCHGTTWDIPGTSLYLTPPSQSQLSQVAMGQPRTSRDIPLPNTTLPVPGPSCPKLPWDNLGHPRTSYYLTPPCQSQVRVVPSCHGTTRDILGHLTT